MSQQLNELQNATVGMTVGVIEVLLLQPFNYAKNMTQQKQPISLNPMTMYRGVGANCINMGSCTMIQFAIGGKLKNMITGGDNSKKLTIVQEMGTGIGAGTVSALVGSPLELIMIQQQRKGGSTLATIKNIATPDNIMRGFSGAAVREALWTCGYLSIPPIVRGYLMENHPDTFKTSTEARVPASLLGGLFACYLTQPFDTVKTCMQGDIERKTYGSFSQTAKKIYGESSIPGFYRGATFRYGRMVCAVFIMDTLKEMVGPLLYPKAFE
mmetsp:Transcript_5613/g.8633  ORF Transcript_5613/g.8633 Transcript_5613/m.8633 type:complete len:269 (+) Transcript_5613:100-906(+)|eukprot:CAMPEP_0195284882 /NCGR_PEP_ID=MMETSP0707-20130614/2921_1 /TAXON_ID=33640 /ORGANISM="Asterionellopsis glacialis, Strain CCMP134" /LENGTH=268 /DNA_ID=CAMNT_0040344287 /DNA_START=75 /DNA_END=881 /DNA_ORIENTATION=+